MKTNIFECDGCGRIYQIEDLVEPDLTEEVVRDGLDPEGELECPECGSWCIRGYHDPDLDTLYQALVDLVASIELIADKGIIPREQVENAKAILNKLKENED